MSVWVFKHEPMRKPERSHERTSEQQQQYSTKSSNSLRFTPLLLSCSLISLIIYGLMIIGLLIG